MPMLSLATARPQRPMARTSRVVARAASADVEEEATKVGFEDLIDVIKAIDSTDVVEMELKGKRFALSVKKQEALLAAEPVFAQAPAAVPAAAVAPPPVQPAPVGPAQPQPASVPPPPAANGAAAPNGVEISSPMSGTVYRKPAPGEPLFVKEGDKVAKGQTICIVEAMKLMNEIEADVAGTVVKFVAEDAQPIGASEVLCIIDPA